MEQKKLRKNKPVGYLSNDDLYKEIIKSKAQDKLTDEAIKMLILMCKKINLKFRYENEMDREDVLQFSYLRILQVWKNFDETRYTNTFSYYTEIIKRAHAFEFNFLNKYNKNISINNYYNDGNDLNI